MSLNGPQTTPVSKALVKDIEKALEKHGIDKLYYPFVLGQCLDVLKEQSIRFSAPAVLNGLIASNIIRRDCAKTIKELVLKLVAVRKDAPLNYNDLDEDLYARHEVIPHECSTCSGVMVRLGLGGSRPEKKDCKRCKGTGLDPVYNDQVYCLYHDSHGNAFAYFVVENSCAFSIHVRVFPYNMSKKKAQKIRTELFQAVVDEAGDKEINNKYFRYQDGRDEGFVLSFYIHKEQDIEKVAVNPDAYKNEKGEIDDTKIPYEIGTADGEANITATHALEIIAGDFSCVIEEFETLEKEDSLHRDKVGKS